MESAGSHALSQASSSSVFERPFVAPGPPISAPGNDPAAHYLKMLPEAQECALGSLGSGGGGLRALAEETQRSLRSVVSLSGTSGWSGEHRQLLEVLERELEDSLGLFVEEDARKTQEIRALRSRLRECAQVVGRRTSQLEAEAREAVRRSASLGRERDALSQKVGALRREVASLRAERERAREARREGASQTEVTGEEMDEAERAKGELEKRMERQQRQLEEERERREREGRRAQQEQSRESAEVRAAVEELREKVELAERARREEARREARRWEARLAEAEEQQARARLRLEQSHQAELRRLRQEADELREGLHEQATSSLALTLGGEEAGAGGGGEDMREQLRFLKSENARLAAELASTTPAGPVGALHGWGFASGDLEE